MVWIGDDHVLVKVRSKSDLAESVQLFDHSFVYPLEMCRRRVPRLSKAGLFQTSLIGRSWPMLQISGGPDVWRPFGADGSLL